MIQHTSIPTEGVKTLRKRQSSLPITPPFWGSGWGHGGPAVLALMLPISRNFLGRWNHKKNSIKEEQNTPLTYLITALKTKISRGGMIWGYFTWCQHINEIFLQIKT